MPIEEAEKSYDFKKIESKVQSFWEDEEIFSKTDQLRENGPQYSFLDGPPYCSGKIHLGTTWNKVIKDTLLRYKSMNGFSLRRQAGWDTHGLPIENAVIKSGVNRKTTEVSEFRKKCDEYAHIQIEKQKIQQLSLGVIGDYSNPYLTLSKEFEANEVEMFATLALNGLIYKGLKPVYWSPTSESVLAEAEIEYYDKEDTSIYVAFKVKDGKGVLTSDDSFVIWTTTPWTIPANLAICLNERLEYGLFETEKEDLFS